MNQRVFLVLALFFLHHLAAAQRLGRVEYFFDVDPGYGNGISWSLSPNSQLTLDESITVGELEPGMHQFFIRAQTEEGIWSMTQSRVFFLAPRPALSQTLHGLEYFFNEDPGFGRGTKIPVGQDQQVVLDLQLPLSGLNPGFHQLFIRALNNDGSWSMSSSRIFFLQPLDAEQKHLQAMEYFVDEDPGFGNGTSIPFNASSNLVLDFSADLQEKSLEPGFHLFFLRVKDEQGNWSMTQKRVFFLQEGSMDLSPISRFEYFLEAENYHSGTKVHEVEPAPLLDLDLQFDLSFLPEINRAYQLSIYAVNENGVRSMVEQRPVTICSGDPPKADFEYQLLENRLLLKSNSTSADSLQWLFGEEVFHGSEIELPTQGPGSYEISLVAGNICGLDTLHSSIILPGIINVSPKVASILQEEARFRVEVLGIENLEQIKLIDEAGQELLPLDVVQVDSLSYFVRFDLSQAALGAYRLEVRAEDNYTFAHPIQLFEGGDFPFGEWVSFEIPPGESFQAQVQVPELEKFQVFLKKADRLGYSGTWSGELRLKQGEEVLGILRGNSDYNMEFPAPQAGLYELEILPNSHRAVTGMLMVSESPEWMPLNQWIKGEILRPYGNDWKYIDIGSGIDTLFFQTEGYGMWSQLEVFYQQMEKPDSHWRFSRRGRGYALSGHVPSPKPGRYYLKYMDSAVLQHTLDGNQRRDYLIHAGTLATPPHSNGNQEILELSAYETGQGISTFEVHGFGFTALDSLVLMNVEDSTLIGLSTRWVNAGLLEFTHDFSDLAPGAYSVGLFGSPFLFHETPIALIASDRQEIVVDIIGRDQLRIGRFQKYVVRVKNTGLVDKNFIGILISGIPESGTFRIDNTIEAVGDHADLEENSLYEVIDGEIHLPLFINNLPAGEFLDIELSIYLPEMKDFELDVTVDEGFADQFEFLSEEDLFDYMMAISELDSMLHLLQQWHLEAASARRLDIIQDQVKETTERIYAYFNDPRLSGISDDCASAMGRSVGSIATTATKAYYEANKEKFLNTAFKGLMADWGKCLYSSANTIKDNLWDPFSNRRERGMWNTAKTIFSQPDLYFNVFNSGLNCVNAFLNTPITPVGGIRFLARTMGTRTSRAVARRIRKFNQSRRDLDQRLENIRNWQKVGDIVGTMVGSTVEGMDIGLSLSANCEQDIKKTIKTIASISSVTPEDKYGPIGFDQGPELPLSEKQRYIAEGELFSYQIDYWNKEDATAPAAEVFIRDTLDTNFDINTVNFTEIGFLRWKMPLEGGQYFDVMVDMRPDKNLLVQVTGTVDSESREIYWVHRSLDPETMELPDDPMAGYLPPIDTAGYNIGWVSFTVEPLDSLGHNTLFQNQAHVNFDGVGPWGPAPPYGPYTNTIDQVPPVSMVNPLPHRLPPSFEVTWTGEDDGSGVAQYTVYVSKDSTEFVPWLTQNTDTLSVFRAEEGSLYAFYSIAEDKTGNQELKADTVEAWTFVPPLPPMPDPVFPTGILVKSEQFHWNPSREADGYRIQVARDSLFQSVAADEYTIDTLFLWNATPQSEPYYWRVSAYNVTGESEWSTPLSFTVDPITGIQKVGSRIPEEFYMGAPYPNPNQGTFMFEVHIPETSRVSIDLGTATGQQSLLLHNESLSPGIYNIEVQLPPGAAGLYFCRVLTRDFKDTKKVWVLK